MPKRSKPRVLGAKVRPLKSFIEDPTPAEPTAQIPKQPEVLAHFSLGGLRAFMLLQEIQGAQHLITRFRFTNVIPQADGSMLIDFAATDLLAMRELCDKAIQNSILGGIIPRKEQT